MIKEADKLESCSRTFKLFQLEDIGGVLNGISNTRAKGLSSKVDFNFLMVPFYMCSLKLVSKL